jgi:hypothetical protein
LVRAERRFVVFEISLRVDRRLMKLPTARGEERFRLLLALADDARKLYEVCLEEAVDMDLSAEHNIEAHNVACAGRNYDPLRGRNSRAGPRKRTGR